MDLVLKHARATVKIPCHHCDRDITVRELRYVKFNLGDTEMVFHEECYRVVTKALQEFLRYFLDERQGERHLDRLN